MKHVATPNLEAQLFGLGTLVQLLKRARQAETEQELAFIIVNETHNLVPYRQAVLWRRDREGRGKVIAVNSAIARVPGSGALGAQSGNIGLGFAIPSQQARRTVEQLIQTGKAVHPVIGVLLDRSYTGEGVRVSVGRGSAYDLFLTRALHRATLVRAPNGPTRASA